MRAVNSTCFRMFPGCGIPSRAYGVFMTGLTPGIYLEHMACDLTPIGHWLPLPSEYRYARRASRDELRDFFYLLGCDDTLAQATR